MNVLKKIIKTFIKRCLKHINVKRTWKGIFRCNVHIIKNTRAIRVPLIGIEQWTSQFLLPYQEEKKKFASNFFFFFLMQRWSNIFYFLFDRYFKWPLNPINYSRQRRGYLFYINYPFDLLKIKSYKRVIITDIIWWGLLDYTTIFSPLINSSFIQYCDSNIGLFSFASYKFIALQTVATAIVVALTRS